MFVRTFHKGRILCAAIAAMTLMAGARADETPPPAATAVQAAQKPFHLLVDKAASSVHSIQETLETAMDLIGISYRRGGSTPETGFDCSGYVRHVFQEGLGLYLPRSAKEMSGAGEPVDKEALKPGDLVFFNTMRRTFSHVGIYLGNSLFIHAPRSGGVVRIEDLRESYWAKRFNGARRVSEN